MTQRTRTRELMDELAHLPCPGRPPCPPCPPHHKDESGQLVFNTIDQFPETGDTETLYFDNSTGTLYYWTENEGYIMISSGGSIEKSHIDGGGAEDG